MCHFIYMLLPKTANSAAVETLCRQHELAFRPIQSDKIASPALFEGEQCYLTTKGTCDCNTALISYDYTDQTEQSHDSELAKCIEKLRKKGWRKHKIESWLAQKITVEVKKQQSKHDANKKHIDGWYDLLHGVLQKKLSPYVGICVLWEDKATAVNNRVEIKISPDFAPLQQNTIYIFT